MRFKVRSTVGLSLDYWKVFSATTISSLGSGISGVALPWIASSLTRDPIAISLITLAGQLPWILFTLHAGVLIDRMDKKRILIAMDILRGIVTALIALVIYLERNTLGQVTKVNSAMIGTRWGLLSLLIFASLAIGFATVLADTTSQAVLPSVATKEQLPHANGRIWAAISVSEQFVGPPLGSLLLSVAAFLPLLFDAGSFFLSAGLIILVTAQIGNKVGNKVGNNEGNKKDTNQEVIQKPTFKADIKEGFHWLWSHKLFKNLALTLGLLNLVSGLSNAAFILFAQEVLHAKVYEFALMNTGFAIGGIIGGTFGPRLASKFTESQSLQISLIGMAIAPLMMGLASSWLIIWFTGIYASILITLWNIVTVSFRQTVIPEHLFGRVNSVYRFFGTGGAPLGALLGGVLVSIFMHFMSRPMALRLPFFLDAALVVVIFFLTRRSFSDSEFQAAKSAANDR